MPGVQRGYGDSVSDAERPLVGALLLRPDLLEELAVYSGAFVDGRLGQIVWAMQYLHVMGLPIDVVEVADVLRAWEELDDVGGLPALIDLQAECPDTTKADEWWAQMWGHPPTSQP